MRLHGPNQWPKANPQLREIVEDYVKELTKLAKSFLELIAEAFELPHDLFFPFLSDQHRLKLVHYKASSVQDANQQGQGVGPHKDSSGWMTFLLQASPPSVKGLQVLTKEGQWIDVPAVPGTFVARQVIQQMLDRSPSKCSTGHPAKARSYSAVLERRVLIS
jgi:isopenicillin N synthase-like dioxygenase